MQPDLYLIYYPTGYYPLVMVGYAVPDGGDLVLCGSRVVAQSGVSADWSRLADEGPEFATLHAAANHEIRVPRQCISHRLPHDKWETHIPEAVAKMRGDNGT